MANVNASEQLMLELINLARLDPAGEAQRLGIDLNADLPAGTINANPKQPLAFNDLLVTAARNHSVWQIDNDVFSHIGVGGSSPGDRMAAAGYAFTGLWGWGENIAWRGVASGPLDAAAAIALQHDSLFLSPGHRTNLLNDGMREIGVGQAIGSFMRDGTNWAASIVTQDFAYAGTQLLLTGVVYQDINEDARYGVGEGLGNWEAASRHYACVTRPPWVTRHEFYVLPLRERLPAIRVPLRRTDPDVALDLQSLVDDCYLRGRYSSVINYACPPYPPLPEEEAAWAKEVLAGK